MTCYLFSVHLSGTGFGTDQAFHESGQCDLLKTHELLCCRQLGVVWSSAAVMTVAIIADTATFQSVLACCSVLSDFLSVTNSRKTP